ncbi:MAG: hypothetical protein NC452_11140 [Eubacterium sp.]|nr:hypothetical protein [Eubacterium sp.]
MIRKINSFHAEVVIKTRQPLGLFYVRQNGAYIGIDNSAGHAWVEEFSDLNTCKQWLRNPSLSVQILEQEGVYEH